MQKLGYKALLEEKNYMRVFCANMVNRFGDSIDALAFAWMVYEITGDRSWSALIVAFNTIPTIALMPFAGVLVEKYDKRLVMILTDIGRAVLVSLVVCLYAMGMVTPLILALSTLLMSTFEAFRVPASLALYPRIVPREKFTLATSFSQSLSSVFVILGASAFGPVVATMGVEGAMLINAATFVISACLVFTVRLPKETRKAVKMNAQHFFVELRQGFRYLYGKRVIFLICILGSLIGVLLIPIDALKTPYVHESLGQGSIALSVMSIASMLGTMTGSACFPLLNRRISKANLFILGGGCNGMAYFLYVAISALGNDAARYAALAGTSFFYGIGSAMLSVVINVAFMEHIEPAYISRVGSIFNSFASALAPAGSLLVAGIATFLTVNQVFLVFGAITLLFYSGMSFSKLFRDIDMPQMAVKEESA